MAIEAYIDLDNDRYTMFVNNRAEVVSGEYLMGFERVNFYAYWNNAFYIDNICFSMVESVPSASRVANIENALLENVVKPTAATTTSPSIGENYAADVSTTTTRMKQDLKVFPNPTTGNFIYQGQLTTTTSLTVEIFNQLGQSVRHVKVEDMSFLDLALDLNNLPDGIYLLQAYSGKVLDTQRIVLQR